MIQAQHVGPAGSAVLHVTQVGAVSQLDVATPGEQAGPASALTPSPIRGCSLLSPRQGPSPNLQSSSLPWW